MILGDLRRALREDRLTALLFLACAVAVLLPVWIGRYLPLLDYPNHLSVVFVWRHLDDPAWGFARWYESHLVPLPYWAQYAFVYALSIPLGVELAQKLFVSTALLALPVGLALLARRLGRDPRLAIFAFPLAWNFNVAFGFLSYAAGTAVLLLALALLDAFLDAPSIRRGLAAALVGASLYFFHILSWGSFLAIGGVMALFPRPRPSLRTLLGAIPLVPAAALGLWAFRRASTMNVKVNPQTAAGWSAYQMIFHEPAGVLHNLPDWLLNFHRGGFDEAMTIALGLALILLCATPAARSDEALAARDRGLARLRHPAAFLVACALLFYLPRTLHRPFYWYAINSRLAVLVALLAALFVRGPLGPGAGRPRRALLALAAAASIALCVDVALHVRRFNDGARGFDEVIAKAPRGARVLPIMLALGSPEVNVNAFNQWGSYVQMHTGGYVPYNNDIDFPIRIKGRIPAQPWDRPDAFSYPIHGRHWDYFLVHGPSPVDPFRGAHEDVELVAASGDWQLFKNLRPPPP